MPSATVKEPARKALFAGRACERFVIENVTWASYESLLRDFREHGPRMTYDRGRLEFMMPLHPHESYGHLLGRLIE